jgi:septal ring factor EnvC (AmiA/AmiB activator)
MRRTRKACSGLLAAALISLGAPAGRAGELDKAVEMLTEANQASARTQGRIDKLSEEAGELLAQYRAVQQQIESVRAYNAQVEKMLEAQREEIRNLQGEIGKATDVGREMTPLMLRMIDALEAFVSLDVPFLPEERRMRVQNLRDMMNRADVADSEKYQRLLEAYLIETEFGRNIEAYKGALATGGETRTVNFLRVGRVAYAYLTLDGKEAGVWNQKTRAWEILPAELRKPIELGLRVARKEMAPDLIRLPIFAPEEAP